jgi:hypothetical protein
MHEVEVRRSAALERRDDWPELFGWLSDNLHTFQSSLGPFVGRSTPTQHHGDWDEDSFFRELAVHNPTAAQPARLILAWGKRVMPQIYWGHGEREGSFMPAVQYLGTAHSIVSVYTTGMFYVRFAALKKEPPFDDEGLRLELLARLNQVPHFDLPPAVIERYAGLPLALLAESGAMEAFIDAMEWSLAFLRKP